MYSQISKAPKTVATSPRHEPPTERRAEELTAWLIFARLTRVSLWPALLMPVLWGSALAWWQTGTFTSLPVMFLTIAYVAFGASLSLLDYYHDYRRSDRIDSTELDRPPTEAGAPRVQRPEQVSPAPRIDGFLCLVEEVTKAGTVRSLAYIAYLIAVLAVIWLGLLYGWPLWFFGSLTALFLVCYWMPALRYSHWWWIVGETGLLFAMGILPTLSAYYAQTQTLSQVVLISSLTPAVLTWLAFQVYTLYSWRRDWKLGKRTVVVILGSRRALDAATAIGLLAFIATLLLVALDDLPVWSLIVLGALPTFLRAFARGHHPAIQPRGAVQAIDHSAYAAALAGLLSILALWIAS